MEKARQISGISFLAEEILVDILSRLPVKTLLRLKGVCKLWCTLISSPWFISLHLKRYNSDPDDPCFFVQTWKRNNGLISLRNPNFLIKPNEPCLHNYIVVGSINGLVCLTDTGHHNKSICLWNPSINQFKNLSMRNMNLHKPRECYVNMGFGYEQDSDDYKVMMILNNLKGRPATIVQVYSTKLESWRELKLDVLLNMNTYSYCDVIVEGFTYWVAKNMNEPRNTVITSFDLRSETFSVISVPEVMVTGSISFRGMNYHGSFALLAHSSHSEFNKTCLEVWMIEGDSSEEGVWQKKFTFGIDFAFSMPWGLTSGDIYILVENSPNMPYLFNHRTKQLRVIGVDSILSVFYYTESLVSVKGFKPVPNQLREKGKASIPMKKNQDRANRHILG